MTLNITIVSRHFVYMSSDFRLTYQRLGRSIYYTDDEAQKIVLFSTLRFNALVQFCGLAKAGSFDTSKWLARLSQEISKNAPVSELLMQLREANSNVRGDRITFTVAGFEGSSVFAHLISNFQHINPSQDHTISRSLTRSTLRVTGTHSFATGLRKFVDSAQLRNLRRLVIGNAQPRRIQERLAEVNAEAATTAGPNGGISTACFTGHLTSQKTGEITPHGVDEGRDYLPEFVMAQYTPAGLVLEAKLDSFGRPLPRRFIGMTLKSGSEDPNLPVETITTLAAFRNVQDPKTTQSTS